MEDKIKIQQELDDYECLKALREAKSKEANAKTASLDDVKKRIEP